MIKEAIAFVLGWIIGPYTMPIVIDLIWRLISGG